MSVRQIGLSLPQSWKMKSKSVPGEGAFQNFWRLTEVLDLWEFKGQQFGSYRPESLTSNIEGTPSQIVVLAASSGFPFVVTLCSALSETPQNSGHPENCDSIGLTVEFVQVCLVQWVERY